MRQRITAALLTLPGLAWLTVFMVIPCLIVFTVAFFERGVYGGVDWSAPTLENFVRAADPLYLTIFLDSIAMAGLATAIAVLIAYPAAYAIVLAPARWQTALLFLAMLPFWTNYLIRTYAWIVLLNREGVISRAAMALGLASEPLPILYNGFAVTLGLVYNYVPFVILAIYSALQRLDPSYAEASRDLGAGAWTTFLKITLPLTAPGVAAGAVFVFVLSVGNFVTGRQLRDAGPARRRQGADGGEPDLRPVPHRPRLAIRRGALDGADRTDDGASVPQRDCGTAGAWRCPGAAGAGGGACVGRSTSTSA